MNTSPIQPAKQDIGTAVSLPCSAGAKKFHSPQGVLERMPLHQKQVLMGWLTTGGKYGQGITYSEAQARLLADFGVKTNARKLCEFFQRHQRAPIPAVSATLSPDRQILTLRINLNLLSASTS